MFRVLFPFAGDTVGGSHISSWQLICALRAFGEVEPIILLHKPNGIHASWLSDHGETYKMESLPLMISNWRFLRTNFKTVFGGSKKASEVVKRLGIDIIHANDGRMNRSWAVWAKQAGIPMVWHQRARWNSIKNIQTHWSFTAPSGIIYISEYVASSAPSLNLKHKTILNPIKVEERNPEKCAISLRSELGLEKEAVVIGCFANSRTWKRPDIFVKVAVQCQKSHPNMKFVWFGNDYDGSLKKAIQDAQKVNKGVNIIHAKFRQDVLTSMAGCDVLLATSEGEPFGRTLVEAMALGIPVVASNSGGHSETVRHKENGLLFPVEDYQNCKSCLVHLIEDAVLRSTLIENGKMTAKRFSPHNHALKVLEFYQQLLGKML